MKNVFQLKTKVVTLLAVLFFAVSCTKDEEATTITEADAADAIEASLTTDSNGVAKMASDASMLASTESVYTERPNLNCGQEYTVQYNPVYTGAYYSYDYSGSRTYAMNCATDGTPESLTYTADVDGTYETPRMTSDDNWTGTIDFTQLGSSSDVAVINGSYVRNGYQESKVRQRRSFNSVITINLSDVQINKITRVIAGGTASVSITGAGSGGNSFSYNGSITFNGNSTATLVINGNTYTINL